MDRQRLKTIIRRAAKQAGGQAALADKMGVSRQAFNYWFHGKQGISAEQAVALEKATGGAVTRGELRPDLWGDK